jgi:hypothetical protein
MQPLPPITNAPCGLLEHQAMYGLGPGDVLLFRNGERGWLNGSIEAVQYRKLREQYPDADEALLRDYAKFTHAGVIASPEAAQVGIAEMIAPKARFARFCGRAGSLVLVRRFRFPGGINTAMYEERKHGIGRSALVDVDIGVPYGYRELMHYALAWKIFRSPTRDVCSGRVVYWARHHGFMPGCMPVDWYPALLGIDETYLEHKAYLRIMS